MIWLAIKAVLLKLKANIIWIGTAAIAGVVAYYRWRFKRAEKKIVAVEKEREVIQEKAAGLEVKIEKRQAVEAELREVAERQKTDPGVDLRKPW